MVKTVLTIDGRRDTYSVDQQIEYGTMTVGQLIGILEEYDEDMLVMLNNDNGYTYGAITEYSFQTEDSEDDDYEDDYYEDEDDEDDEED